MSCAQKKIKAEHEYRSSMPASTYQQQKLRVCEVCSAYLGIHDNDIRLADHFGGKLHLGFMTIREKLTELEKTAAPRKDFLKKTGNYRDRDDDRFKNRYYVGGRELDRRSRVHRSKSRDRERKRDAESTSGNNKRKSKSKSRSRSRSRSRSKSHHSRRRSRSRERSSKNDRHDRDRRDREREHRRR